MSTDSLDAQPRLLSPNQALREDAPSHVWDWRSYESWRTTVWRLMSDVLDERVRAEFSCRPPEYVVSDDLRWLDQIVLRATGLVVDTKALMNDRLVGHFTHMRACHATRTSDVGAYYREGLLPLDPAVAHERAEAIFLGGDFPELSADDLDKAIRTVGANLRQGRVFFEANERLLIEQAGHYLLYGGEYLIAIAAHLPSFRDYRQVLKAFGEPTMFVCDVPLANMNDGILLEFSGMALEMMFEEILQAEDFEPDWHRGAGFSIRRGLAPSNIVGHYYPESIRDPFARY